MTQNPPLVLAFSEIRRTDLHLVGGKGANLGELTQLGLPVPPGFCLTTGAFGRFVETCPNAGDLYRLLDTVGPGDLEAVRRAGKHIRETLLRVPIPDEIADAVQRAWRGIGTQHAYAVRSSATAEDLPGASFAGQQDSYLNVIGASELLEAVRRCWASLFTDRAILYRVKNGFQHRDVQLSVVVQQMILAESSGILFTADPFSGHRHTAMIDASFGLGEAIVGGLVTPDTYRIDKRTRSIVAREIADKQIAIYADEDGGTRQVRLTEVRRRQQVLSDAQVLALADIAVEIEAHYGEPQDIEWAIGTSRPVSKRDDAPPPSFHEAAVSPQDSEPGELFVLQTRPITSLYPTDGLRSPDDNLHIYFSLGHQQSMTRAMAPLTLTTLKKLLLPGHEEDGSGTTFLRASGGRMFVDITTPLLHPALRRVVLAVLSQLDALGPAAARVAMQRPEFRHTHRLRIRGGTLRRALSIARRVLAALWWRDLTGFVKSTNEHIDDYVAGVSRRLMAHESGESQLSTVLDELPQVMPVCLDWMPEAGAGVVATRLLSRLARRWLPPAELEALTLGIPGNVVNEMNLALDDLASTVHDCPALMAAFDELGDDGQAWLAQVASLECSGPFLQGWDAFIAAYGMRGPSEIALSMPRWHEEPLSLLQVVAGALGSAPGSRRARETAHIEARQAAWDKLKGASGRGIVGPLRVRLLERLYNTMVAVGGMREHHKFFAVCVLGVIKGVLQRAATQLVVPGKLSRAEDIWFLTWPELCTIWHQTGGDWEGTIARRRADLARYQKLTVPLIITSDGEVPAVKYSVADAPPDALLGNPVSAGVVEGAAHVIRDPQREMLAPGEILVAEFTDPGWTPLFINAGGLILEVGGALTHGAVVAREYGIPAVVGVRDATNTLQTGQRVRVDGNRGIIERV